MRAGPLMKRNIIYYYEQWVDAHCTLHIFCTQMMGSKSDEDYEKIEKLENFIKNQEHFREHAEIGCVQQTK